MPLCVHCSTPTKDLIIKYGPNHIICTNCKNCGEFTDPYVEHEIITVIIDLILVKPKAYRHLLFNTTSKDKEDNLKNWLKLTRHFFALILIDSYLRWFNLCATNNNNNNNQLNSLIIENSKLKNDLLISFFKILISNSILHLILYSTILILSIIYYKILSILQKKKLITIPQMDFDRFKNYLIPSSLLLANLTPTFLLCLLLLWQQQDQDQNQNQNLLNKNSQWNELNIDWTIRNLVSGLSAGVGLGVVLPLQRTKIGATIATLILLIGWFLEFFIANQWLNLPFHSSIANNSISIKRYCKI